MHQSIAVQRDNETQALEVKGDRDYALGYMRHGIAALCIEQQSFGELAHSLNPNAREIHLRPPRRGFRLGKKEVALLRGIRQPGGLHYTRFAKATTQKTGLFEFYLTETTDLLA